MNNLGTILNEIDDINNLYAFTLKLEKDKGSTGELGGHTYKVRNKSRINKNQQGTVTLTQIKEKFDHVLKSTKIPEGNQNHKEIVIYFQKQEGKEKVEEFFKKGVERFFGSSHSRPRASGVTEKQL